MAARVKYGQTVWGAWFLRMLESYNDTGRLLRGKSYANTGKVWEVKITGARIQAKVAGNYRPFYKVSLEFPLIQETELEKIRAFVKENPLILTRLAQGEFPPELIEKIETESISLIPRQFSALKGSCSCPDYGDPCKHQAAVLFVLAREIDQNPQFLCSLAGIDGLTSTKESGDTKNFQSAPRILHPVIERANIETVSENSSQSTLQCTYVDFITRLLPQKPVFTQESFIISLTELYHRALKDSYNHIGEPLLESAHHVSHAHYSVQMGLKIGLKKNSEKTDFPIENAREVLFLAQYQAKENAYTPYDGAIQILSCPDNNGSLTYRILRAICRAALTIVHAGAFIPSPFVSGSNLRIFWKAFTASREVDVYVRSVAAEIELLAVTETAKTIQELLFGSSKEMSKKSSLYITELLLCTIITDFVTSLRFNAKETYAPLFFAHECADLEKPGERSLGDSLANWLSVLQYGKGDYAYRLSIAHSKKSDNFKLSAEVKEEKTEQSTTTEKTKSTEKNEPDRFITLSQAVSLKQKQNAPLRDIASLLHFPLAFAAYIPHMALLGEKKKIVLTEEEVIRFLNEVSPVLRAFAVETIIPKELQKLIKPRLALSVKTKTAAGGNTVSWFNMDELLQYDLSIMLGDTEVSLAEFEELLKQNKKMVRFRDRFVLLDAEQVASLLRQTKNHKEPSSAEVLQEYLSGEAVFSADAEQLAKNLFKQHDIPVPQTLNATLRPYQQAGFCWLYNTLQNGFGCLLADDMGLGKTIQIIALLLRLKADGVLQDGALVIAPMTLLINWQREIEKFAPDLTTYVYHGPKRRFPPEQTDVILSTYRTIALDEKKLATKTFALLILDEAQAIKNVAAKNAKAVRSVQTLRRVALTGTPVENRLEDMRALFDVLIPGYLGSAEAFRNKWRIPIELHNDKTVADEFKKITAPFLLRRMKTDKSIISDLPEKIMADKYITLSKEQTALYETVTQSLLESIVDAEDQIKRSGMMFKLLTALKQICDHPYVFDKISPPDSALSGKCVFLVELLGEILERGEKVLVFSQYVETLTLLETIIKKELGEDSLMLTGKTPPAKRTLAVDAFQNDDSRSIFLISLKAGGTGLNLTKASHVIHFDLWYNPAVEDQATDRAFRIGQKNNVCVHRFICAGTFEEKIDGMIKAKRGFANLSVTSGETWLSSLSGQELKELFSVQ